MKAFFPWRNCRPLFSADFPLCYFGMDHLCCWNWTVFNCPMDTVTLYNFSCYCNGRKSLTGPATVTSCIDVSVRIVTKSPKVGRTSTYILHLSGCRDDKYHKIKNYIIFWIPGEEKTVGQFTKNYRTLKKFSLSSQNYGFGTRDRGSGKNLFQIRNIVCYRDDVLGAQAAGLQGALVLSRYCPLRNVYVVQGWRAGGAGGRPAGRPRADRQIPPGGRTEERLARN